MEDEAKRQDEDREEAMETTLATELDTKDATKGATGFRGQDTQTRNRHGMDSEPCTVRMQP